MGSKENEDHVIESIRMLTEEIFSFDLDNFVMSDETEELAHDLERCQKLLKSLSVIDLTKFDSKYLHNIDTNLRYLRNYIREVKTVLKDEKRKEEIPSRVKDVSEGCSNLFAPILMALTANLVLSSESHFSLIDVLEEMNNLKKKSLEVSKKILVEMNAAQRKVEDMYSNAVIAKHAGNFNEEAVSQRNQAYYWLGISILIVFSLIWYTEQHLAPEISKQISEFKNSSGKFDFKELLISKTVIFSAITYFFVVSIRNFSAHKHNWTVNIHRRNSLSTFETFLECSQDPQTKEALLLQVADAVFKPQPTGYVKNDGDHSSGNHVVEIIRDLSKGH